MIYNYLCKKCNAEEEVTLRLKELEGYHHYCKECQKEMVRTIGPSTFILKGSCWARDGYARTIGDDIRFNETTGLDGVPSDEL